MAGDAVIRVEGLSKRYTLGARSNERYTALRDVMATSARNLLRRGRRDAGRKVESTDFWALKDVSFEVKRGEVLGIIGRNGAGKARCSRCSRASPSRPGAHYAQGPVASLLEVGTGFHPELTGRENIYLNGAILGMHRAEIKAKFDEIVAFAEVERFLDTPVKRYSSGMYVRLAFAVAAHLEPEILIVDEVLAVGDAEFQKKCLGKMQDVAQGEGRTVLFVSHNISALRALCSRALVLRRGQLIHAGDVAACLAIYSAEGGNKENAVWVREASSATPTASGPALTLEKICVTLEGQQPLRTLLLDIDLKSRAEHKPASLAIDILDSAGTAIMQALPISEGLIVSQRREHRLRVTVALPPLVPGRYFVTVWTGSHNTETLDQARAAAMFESDISPVPDRSYPHTPDHGYIVAPSTVEERFVQPEPSMELTANDTALLHPR